MVNNPLPNMRRLSGEQRWVSYASPGKAAHVRTPLAIAGGASLLDQPDGSTRFFLSVIEETPQDRGAIHFLA
jgi:hypothetical protein